MKKNQVIARALKKYRLDGKDAVEVLAKVGGLDLAGMCGLFIGAAETGAIAIIDGVISSAAALCAVNICPACKEYMIASHTSGEPAAQLI